MRISPRTYRVVKAPQEGYLFGCQIDRCFYGDPRKQITLPPVANGCNALAAQAEILSGLRTGRNLQRNVSVECWQFHLTAQRGCRETDRYLTGEVGTFAMKYFVWIHAYLDIQITRWTTVSARLAFAGKADSISIINAFRYAH